jgi:cytoskeletal protein CcmA (bactofilin family)
MVFIKTTAILAILTAAGLVSPASASSSKFRSAPVAATGTTNDDMLLRRLADLEQMVTEQGAAIKSLHEERRLQQGCAASFNAAAGQCVFANPVTFVNDVTIFNGNNDDATTFRIEGDVNTIIDTDRAFLIGTNTQFASDVLIGTSNADGPGGPSRGRNQANLILDGNLQVQGESYFKDNVVIDKDADLEVEGNLKVDGDADIRGDLIVNGEIKQ